MAIQSIKTSDFSGSIATISEKKDIPFSAKFVKGLNPFEDPSYITLAKATTLKSSTTVTGLVHWFADASPWNTNRYAYDSDGKIYQITNADSFSSLRDNASTGQGFLVHDNYLYYPFDTDIGRYGPPDKSPALSHHLTYP